MDFLTGSAAAQLLAGKRLCSPCAMRELDAPADWPNPVVNALVVDADNVVHTADAIAGSTTCGRDANRWQWVIPAAMPQLNEARRP